MCVCVCVSACVSHAMCPRNAQECLSSLLLGLIYKLLNLLVCYNESTCLQRELFPQLNTREKHAVSPSLHQHHAAERHTQRPETTVRPLALNKQPLSIAL